MSLLNGICNVEPNPVFELSPHFGIARFDGRGGKLHWLVPGRDYKFQRTNGPLVLATCFEDYIREHCLPSGGDPDRAWIAFRSWINALGSDREVASLTRADGRKVVDHELNRKVSSSTARKHLTMGLAALNHARKEERLGKDKVLPAFQMPKASAPRPHWLTPEQVRDLYRVKKSARTHKFLVLAFLTGVRSEAICQLTWDRVDFTNRTMDFRLPGVDHKNKRRPIAPINDELLPRLQYMHERRDPNDPYVIGANRYGKPGTTYGGCKDALAKIGIVKRGVARHIARHTFCSWRVQAGFSYAHIGALVGDTSKMIEDVYGHLSPHHLMAASNMDTSILRVQPTVPTLQ